MSTVSMKDKLMASASKTTNKAVENLIAKSKDCKIEYIDPRLLIEHPMQKDYFTLPDEETYNEIVEAIRRFGILNPLLVRKIKEGVEIISGHTRKHIAIHEIDLATVPIIFLDVDDDESELIHTGTNKWQREYDNETKRKMAIRTVEILERLRQKGHDVGKGKLASIAAGTLGFSARKVEMDIRIERKLIPELKEILINEEMTAQKAYELAALDENIQMMLYKSFKESLTSLTNETIKDIKGNFEAEKTSLNQQINTLTANKNTAEQELEKAKSELQKAIDDKGSTQQDIESLQTQVHLLETTALENEQKIKDAVAGATQKDAEKIEKLTNIISENKIKLAELEKKDKEIELLKKEMTKNSSFKLLSVESVEKIKVLSQEPDSKRAIESILEIIENCNTLSV